MKICLVYIAVTGGPLTADYCARFTASYHEFPPGVEHDTVVCCNGGPLPSEISLMFTGMKAVMFPRPNDPGWDITAYLDAARAPCKDYDMMLCCGESVYFHRAGWLKRLEEAWTKHGPGMYGPFGSNMVRAHLQTTAFACPPSALANYPKQHLNGLDRYEFEHGSRPFWKYIASRGMPVKMVTWDGEWSPSTWRCPHEILWRGYQTNCLMFSNHTERFDHGTTALKIRWARGADAPFK